VGTAAQREVQKRAKGFREEVRRALENGGAGAPGHSRDALEALLRKPAELGVPEEEVELEVEAIQGALDALSLRESIAQARGELPVVEHQHKALGDDRCHFLASVFLASDASSDRTGRLFLTNRRLLFLATPMLSLTWGGIASVDAEARDLVIASTARGVVYRFRCNSFSDARCAVVIARALKNGGGSSPRDSSATAADAQSDSR
jgi:hypothetical protein